MTPLAELQSKHNICIKLLFYFLFKSSHIHCVSLIDHYNLDSSQEMVLEPINKKHDITCDIQINSNLRLRENLYWLIR